MLKLDLDSSLQGNSMESASTSTRARLTPAISWLGLRARPALQRNALRMVSARAWVSWPDRRLKTTRRDRRRRCSDSS